ncbi:hypothetical protein HN014_18065 [Aquimarina sp. TRL1]|uniref:hypothetical protein n=1 Tax=Aquimarina sp. (strain TRL1) TaxID=2736252 RepID=UPI001588EA05|nr:hypothetical protein [Aquimarina sp. TRL1]QKX06742.1 hypothetical protein HN014_18065 [Aquimarina sp. TRL1]
MKFILTTLFVVLAMTLYAQEFQEKYYKHLVFRETPYSATIGRIPISKERAMKENHYKMSYDNRGRLTLIEYRIGNTLISRRRVGILDGFRNIHSRTKIRYEDNKEIRTFYNPKGKQCRNSMNVYEEVYTYNDLGQRTGVHFYDEEGILVNNTWNIATYEWEHVDDHTIVEKRKDTKGTYVTMRPYYHFLITLYKFNKEGILQSMNHINDKRQLINDFNGENGIAIDKPVYDEALNLTGFTFYNANNEAVIGSFLACAGGVVTYDTNGNCIKYATIDLKGRIMLDDRGRAYDTYTFNKQGSLTEIAHYGINNEFVEIRGATRIVFEYDKDDPSKFIKTRHFVIENTNKQ